MSEFTIAVTGHRPSKLWGYNLDQPAYDSLRKEIDDRLMEIMAREFREHFTSEFRLVNGMALGVDQLFCDASIRMRDERVIYFNPFAHVTVEAAVPCYGHGAKWPKASQDAYERLISRCDDVTIVTKAPYSPAAMQLRNEYMVDKADALIAVWNGQRGGTANCVRYAESKDVEIIQINPDEIQGGAQCDILRA